MSRYDELIGMIALHQNATHSRSMVLDAEHVVVRHLGGGFLNDLHFLIT